MGGDGSLTAAHEIAAEIERRDARILGRCIVVAGIPKTMDNDILWVWHSFGLDSAVEEATRAINLIHDDTAATERICIMQLFGRDAGFVAAHAGLASSQADAVLVPEAPFRAERPLDYIQDRVTSQYHALIVIAEGAAPLEYADEYVIERLRREGFDTESPGFRTSPAVNEALAQGSLTFLREKFEALFVRGESGGPPPFRDGRHRLFISQRRHLIRAVPPNSVDQIYCQRLAALAVHSALAGFTDFMISQWSTEYVLVPLAMVAEEMDPGEASGKRRLSKKRIPPSGIFWTSVTNSTGEPPLE